METLFGVIGGLVLIGAINRFIEWRRERREVKAKQQFREESMKDDTQNEKTQKPDTLGLMFKTLSEIGCQPSANDDGTLSVQYQGGKLPHGVRWNVCPRLGSDVGRCKSR